MFFGGETSRDGVGEASGDGVGEASAESFSVLDGLEVSDPF